MAMPFKLARCPVVTSRREVRSALTDRTMNKEHWTLDTGVWLSEGGLNGNVLSMSSGQCKWGAHSIQVNICGFSRATLMNAVCEIKDRLVLG